MGWDVMFRLNVYNRIFGVNDGDLIFLGTAVIYRVILQETDCLLDVQAIRCPSVKLSYFGRSKDDCKKLLTVWVKSL